jgi:hypothetical protein
LFVDSQQALCFKTLIMHAEAGFFGIQVMVDRLNMVAGAQCLQQDSAGVNLTAVFLARASIITWKLL